MRTCHISVGDSHGFNVEGSGCDLVRFRHKTKLLGLGKEPHSVQGLL